MTEPIGFSLDGNWVEAHASESIWQVAQRQGIDIPHLCYDPRPDYRADGNCRVCVVSVAGERTLTASCIRYPTPGMVSTRASRARRRRARP